MFHDSHSYKGKRFIKFIYLDREREKSHQEKYVLKICITYRVKRLGGDYPLPPSYNDFSMTFNPNFIKSFLAWLLSQNILSCKV